MKKILGIFVLLVVMASCANPDGIEVGKFQVIDTLEVNHDGFGVLYGYTVIVQLEDSSLHYGRINPYGSIKELNPKPIMNLKKTK